MNDKTTITFKWVSFVLGTMFAASLGWFVTDHVKAASIRDGKVNENQVSIGRLDEKTTMMHEQMVLHLKTQQDWNTKMDKKIDRLLERDP